LRQILRAWRRRLQPNLTGINAATYWRCGETQFIVKRLGRRINRLSAEEEMLRFAAIGAILVAGLAWTPPAGADAPGEKVKPVAPGCNCPVVHRRVHARVRHRRFVPPPAIAVQEGPDLYNFLVPSPYDPAYDRVVVDHFRTPTVTGYDEPWRPKPVWPGILPYRVTSPDGVDQYDGLIGHYVPLAHQDAVRVAAAALPPPSPPKSSWW
jgi:hypothetical protein